MVLVSLYFTKYKYFIYTKFAILRLKKTHYINECLRTFKLDSITFINKIKIFIKIIK